MFNMIQSENLKYKRTFSRKMLVLMPLLIALLGIFLLRYFDPNAAVFSSYFSQSSINYWCITIMPIGMALLASLSAMKEKKSGQYRALKSKNVNISKMWISKIIVISFYTLITTILVMTVIIALYLYENKFIGNLSQMLIAYLVVWVTTLSLIPIYLFLAELFGTFAAILSSIVGLGVNVFISIRPMWFIWPWSWSARLMCPIVKVHPNGTLLEGANPLLDPSVITLGIAISIITFLVLSFLTAKWFAKREVL
ncbi:lantibiotic immunity ABC transporter MutE/EpiE family permease subunit [Clostridium senegalense]|uniref:lantibiotic immunity ABC transporter MutE/EpiE family permease subunit n=1 Tax=Clostridium senegalense TaxID=1465809 RepID=UPI001C11E432|nr:lantibiotic immunity ABC transporter MutE/EpiE family permease subunit [Clostridium senegalense]MBU5226616.1 lantibiotic immunity ABC transporter MutE/EpiE family permease subunit [Clostridium senegalense]